MNRALHSLSTRIHASLTIAVALHRLSLAVKVPAPVGLGPDDKLKLTFQIVDEDGKGVQPHQTFLRFYDEVTGEEGIQPVKVTPGGKAKFELVSAFVIVYAWRWGIRQVGGASSLSLYVASTPNATAHLPET